MKLRSYQQAAVDQAKAVIQRGFNRVSTERLMISSPTGTGKTYILLELREWVSSLGRRMVIVSPRIEILEGFATKIGLDLPKPATKRRQLLEEHDLYTPVALRNRLIAGEAPPGHVLGIDEAHHSLAPTYELLELLHGAVPVIGVTATPYRGTIKGTQQLREMWGEPFEAITIEQAIADGWYAMPRVEITGLVDDDGLQVRNGEFATAPTQRAYISRLDDLAELCCRTWRSDGRPQLVAVPGTDIARQLAREIDMLGCPVDVITQSTPLARRTEILERVRHSQSMLIQIAVVGEGIDIPELAVVIDAKPTRSPVAFLQLVGRASRPKDPAPRVICTNRNIERHGYLFGGALPPDVYVEAATAFDGPSSRSGYRLGLESLGRHKPIPLPLRDGSVATFHPLYTLDDTGQSWQYAILILPGQADWLAAKRHNIPGRYGTWEMCELPADFTGWKTSSWTDKAAPAQLAAWNRDARWLGLDEDFEPNRREVEALFMLRDLQNDVRLR